MSRSANESQQTVQPASLGVTTALASVLIITIVVDIVGNLLVIVSVFRNKKLRNAGKVDDNVLSVPLVNSAQRTLVLKLPWSSNRLVLRGIDREV